MREVLDRVLVRDKWDLEVHFVDDGQPIVIKGNFNQY
jgi:hypothetical protein